VYLIIVKSSNAFLESKQTFIYLCSLNPDM
jgi:hypothetical protein